MLIYPAIDLFEGKAVRLLRGDYANMTVYSDHPEEIAQDFAAQGASRIHLVDLEGARSGETPNLATVLRIKETAGLFCEVGGGIRSMEIIARYLDAGVDRVILGTAAVTDEGFLRLAVDTFGDRIAVGIDIREGFVAIKGWQEQSQEKAMDFCEKMQRIGVKTLICTDISRDGAMMGANHGLYRQLSARFDMNIIASGGVSSMEDVRKLTSQNIHGAIIGKAYYTGAIDLACAIREAT